MDKFQMIIKSVIATTDIMKQGIILKVSDSYSCMDSATYIIYVTFYRRKLYAMHRIVLLPCTVACLELGRSLQGYSDISVEVHAFGLYISGCHVNTRQITLL